jgi:fructosamine-3-kinase
VDLGYLRAHPDLLPVFLKHQRIRTTPVPGGSICDAERLTLDDGSDLFTKSLTDPPDGFFTSEAAGLHWLHQGCPSIAPEVIAATDQMLVLPWLEPGGPTRAAAVSLGGHLAQLHASGAESFGAPWRGYIGTLPLDNTLAPGPWPDWFAERRLLPYLRHSVDNGALDHSDAALVEAAVARIDRLSGPAEPAARLHDPAAHGGHRETDLATLQLFGGAPYLAEIIAGYQEQFPLADGWQDRVPLHQLHLLLVHTTLFGRGFRGAVLAAARRL